MPSAPPEPTFPLSPSQWLQLRGLGNMETLRQMLKLAEETWGIDLRAGAGGGRQIGADLDALLVRSFARARSEQRAVLEVWREQLEEVKQPVALTAVTRPYPTSLSASETQQLSQLVSAQVEVALQNFLQEQHQLAATERDEQRRLWNREWEHSLHKAEVSFTHKLEAVTAEYEAALRTFEAKRSADAKTLTELSGVMTNLITSVHSLSHSLSQRQWEVSEAKQLRSSMEELLETGRQMEKRHQQLENRARAAIAQSSWVQDVLPKLVWLGVLAGIAVTSSLHLVLPTKFQLFVDGGLLLLALVFGVGLWVWLRQNREE